MKIEMNVGNFYLCMGGMLGGVSPTGERHLVLVCAHESVVCVCVVGLVWVHVCARVRVRVRVRRFVFSSVVVRVSAWGLRASRVRGCVGVWAAPAGWLRRGWAGAGCLPGGLGSGCSWRVWWLLGGLLGAWGGGVWRPVLGSLGPRPRFPFQLPPAWFLGSPSREMGLYWGWRRSGADGRRHLRGRLPT